jgi:hypothetical protein
MKGYFTRAGKYKNYTKVEKVTTEDVKNKKIFDIYDKNAQAFNKSGAFIYESYKAEEKKSEEIKADEDKYKDMTKKEIVEMLKKKGIEADERSRKDDLIKLLEE